jgi:hypothetical protein
MPQSPSGSGEAPRPDLREVEAALRRFGYARVRPARHDLPGSPELWVQEAGVPRRKFPVFIETTEGAGTGSERWLRTTDRTARHAPRAIVVVGDERSAEATWRRRTSGDAPLDTELNILILGGATGNPSAHWHSGIVPRSELLRLATGIVVGLFRRAHAQDGSTEVDFEEILEILRARFGIDVKRTLGVRSDSEALFMLYQMALKSSYAPGDPSGSLHSLVLKPTGFASRVPWFAG